MGHHGSKGARAGGGGTTTTAGLWGGKAEAVSIPPRSPVYSHRAWEVGPVKKLVAARKLAPAFAGVPDNKAADDGLEECPICFLFYRGGLNKCTCCRQRLCSECFLQVNPRVSPTPTVNCPFCSKPNFTVVFTGPLTTEEKEKIRQEEQQVRDLEEKMRLEEIQRDLERQRKREETKKKSSCSTSGAEQAAGAKDAGEPVVPPLSPRSERLRNVKATLSPDELADSQLMEAILASLGE
eukprot:TRINITY_DN7365_c0_g1_i2.p2 TRINITY_DN7365_c0_g1~~TRINITY_DN7365_c0_g1_i2.p2  ORF type:complete len:238 (+),score=65.98 TRINITY_DN7365_c0_g1_i2:1972-2685(+)